MKYAVIQTGGKQYKVVEGQTLSVEKLESNPADTYTFSEVLLVVDEDKKTVGTPTVASAKVSATVVGNKKTAKVRVAKFKAKAKYRRVKGHRQTVTQVKIEKIDSK